MGIQGQAESFRQPSAWLTHTGTGFQRWDATRATARAESSSLTLCVALQHAQAPVLEPHKVAHVQQVAQHEQLEGRAQRALEPAAVRGHDDQLEDDQEDHLTQRVQGPPVWVGEPGGWGKMTTS